MNDTEEEELSSKLHKENEGEISYFQAISYTFILLLSALLLVVLLKYFGIIIFNSWQLLIQQIAWFFLAFAIVLTLHSRETNLKIHLYRLPKFFDGFLATMFFIGFVIVAEYFSSIIPTDGWLSEHYKTYSNLVSQIKFDVPSIVSVVVVAPLFEELFFRAFLLEGLLNKKYKVVYAILMCSLLFGLIHAFVWQVVFAFILGLALGYVYFITRSVLLVIFLHSLNNFIAAYQMFFLKSEFKLLNSQINNSDTILTLSIIGIGIIGYLLYTRKQK